MKKLLLTIILCTLVSCVNTKKEQVVEKSVPKNIQVWITWTVVAKTNGISWIYKFKESSAWWLIEINSKSYDLSKYANKEIFIKWQYSKDIIDVNEITEENKTESGETKKLFEPYKYSNDVAWYSFMINSEDFTVSKWWDKTIVKDKGWDVILQVLLFTDKRSNKKEPLISNDSVEIKLNWVTWEKKEFKTWFDIWLYNQYYSEWNLINIKANYWKETLKNKLFFQGVISSFKFIPKKIQEFCWWKNNIICGKWQICEVSWEGDDSVWKCVEVE